jgi:L-galactono-1,4-lactone dehydrogenase
VPVADQHALHYSVNVDTKKRQVTVEAGCTVERLLEALRPYGLTLENLASINQQQLGGFIQVSAHGTGATVK